MTDNKGFIRFETDEFFAPRVKKFNKMFSISGTMKNYVPAEDNPEYEKYPYKNFTGHYVDPYIACPAEVFCYRYFKLWKKFIEENPWMRFSYTENLNNKRTCKTICVLGITWRNHPYHQYIEIKGLTMDGVMDSLRFDLDSLADICVHVCTKDESNRLMDMLNEFMPEPYIPLFKVHKDLYSKDYNLYLSDCKSCNVKPLPLDMIINATQDFYIDVNTGCLTGITDDCYVVNSFATEGFFQQKENN